MDELAGEILAEDINGMFESNTDPEGSYTGTNPDDPYSEPVQDADDL